MGMLYVVSAIKNVCWAKGEGAVAPSTVNRWFKKFHSGCKNLDDQARSDRPKSEDSEVVLQAMEVDPVRSIFRVSGELGIS